MPLWNGEEVSQSEGPKQRLISWIKSKVPELQINNFTTDWNDGRAIGALVDGVASGLCPDWPNWNKADAIQNASEAMQLADDWLNIPQVNHNYSITKLKCCAEKKYESKESILFLFLFLILSYAIFFTQLIKPEEMVNPNIDEMSMMTYLSQYPNAKLKPGAPLRPRANRNRYAN